MSGRLKVALAGAGMVTRHHLIGWTQIPEVEVVAICNRSVDRAPRAGLRSSEFHPSMARWKRCSIRNGPTRWTSPWRPTCTRNTPWPPPIAASTCCARSPCACNLDDARDLVAKVDNRVRFMVHENWRFRPQYRQAAARGSRKAGSVRSVSSPWRC